MASIHIQPIVVFVFATNRGPTSTRFGGFAKRLQRHGYLQDVILRTVALEDLIFSIDTNQQASIIDRKQGIVFDDASLVYFKSWDALPDAAAAVANYLAAKHIPFFDQTVLTAGTNKLSQLFQLWRAKLSVTPTVYSEQPVSELSIRQHLGKGPFILKPVHGQKGRDNFLVDTPQSAAGQLVQTYVPNDGDFRVLVYGQKVHGALLRKASGSHINNTSAGATSIFFAANEVPKQVASLARSAVLVTNHTLAGVDIIVDKHTGLPYILEVNQGSQIVTGHFTDEKMAAFAAFVERTLAKPHSSTKALTPIGRRTQVDLPELGISNLLAKVDTGAYISALDAKDIRVEDIAGQPTLCFIATAITSDNQPVEQPCTITEFYTRPIRSSSGISETRYCFTTPIVIHGETYTTELTLANRRVMRHAMLLGRQLLNGHFMVNPTLTK